jgi:hypothetical protein
MRDSQRTNALMRRLTSSPRLMPPLIAALAACTNLLDGWTENWKIAFVVLWWWMAVIAMVNYLLLMRMEETQRGWQKLQINK